MIEPRERRRRDGTPYLVYRVRFWDADGQGRNRTFDTLADAETFEAKLKLMKRAGELHKLDAGRETLASFVDEWWETYAAVNLASSTLTRYAEVWNKHMLNRLGGIRLRDLSPRVITGFRVDLERDGVGEATVRKALTMLQGILSRAVEWERISANPAAAVRKPPSRREREIVALPPKRIEALRGHLLDDGRLTDATLVSVLAYGGLRPWSEAVCLTWSTVRERTIRVYAPKTRRQRSVKMLAALQQDLLEWRLACGRPSPSTLVFPRPSGRAWTPEDVRNWRRRIWKPALDACGLPESLVPYDLRHSFASLLLHENRLSVVEIANQLGHAATMTVDTYGHVLDELDDERGDTADEVIRRARGRNRTTRDALGG